MARVARIVVPHYPHHIIQRGNRRQKVFFQDSDYESYLKFLKEYSRKYNLTIVSYCLMPNHVHLIVIPEEENSLALGIGETHRNYTRMIHFRKDWRGYFWQGRFSSYVLDDAYLYNAVKYILFNPVKADIVKDVKQYKWSSLNHHLGKERNPLLNDEILHDVVSDWNEFIKDGLKTPDIDILKKHENTGRPLGDTNFIKKLEKILNRTIRKRKPGPNGKGETHN